MQVCKMELQQFGCPKRSIECEGFQLLTTYQVVNPRSYFRVQILDQRFTPRIRAALLLRVLEISIGHGRIFTGV